MRNATLSVATLCGFLYRAFCGFSFVPIFVRGQRRFWRGYLDEFLGEGDCKEINKKSSPKSSPKSSEISSYLPVILPLVQEPTIPVVHIFPHWRVGSRVELSSTRVQFVSNKIKRAVLALVACQWKWFWQFWSNKKGNQALDQSGAHILAKNGLFPKFYSKMPQKCAPQNVSKMPSLIVHESSSFPQKTQKCCFLVTQPNMWALNRLRAKQLPPTCGGNQFESTNLFGFPSFSIKPPQDNFSLQNVNWHPPKSN